jgi:hypothetical protein
LAPGRGDQANSVPSNPNTLHYGHFKSSLNEIIHLAPVARCPGSINPKSKLQKSSSISEQAIFIKHRWRGAPPTLSEQSNLEMFSFINQATSSGTSGAVFRTFNLNIDQTIFFWHQWRGVQNQPTSNFKEPYRWRGAQTTKLSSNGL